MLLLLLRILCIHVQVLREEEFAPVKNANGSNFDTPDSAKLLVLRLHTRWVVAAGGFLTHSVPLYATGKLFPFTTEERRKYNYGLGVTPTLVSKVMSRGFYADIYTFMERVSESLWQGDRENTIFLLEKLSYLTLPFLSRNVIASHSGVEVSPLCSYAGENLEPICRGRTFHAPCEITF